MDPNEQLHVAVLPWLAAGHLIPFVELSARLSLLGHRVSFLSTPANLLRLPSGLPPLLRPVPLVPSHSFGGSASCTLDISNRPDSDSLRVQLGRTFDSLVDSLSAFLRSASPPVDWLLCDYGSYWAPALAKSSNARPAYVSAFNATVCCFFGPMDDVLAGRLPRSLDDFTRRPPWVPFPTSVAFTPREARKVFTLADDDDVDEATGVSEVYRVCKTIEGCDVVAVRSCAELEREWLELLPDILKKPVIPLGHFPPMRRDCMKNDRGDDWAGAIEWLDEQPDGSVVYVAFGSEVRLSEEETREIARGLELSGLPYVWALRDPAGGSESPRVVDDVGRGIVCRGWVPQGRLLGHPAVGGYMTHCGWNSLVEGLSLGRSLILMPMMYDQPLNARMIAEKGAGREVPRRDDEDGTFDAVGIAETLRLVMVEEAGETYRARARELKSVLGDEGVQDSYVVRFVQHMKDHRPIRTPSASSTDRVDTRGDGSPMLNPQAIGGTLGATNCDQC
ncbi:UDP-glycosyltransferase 91C1-like [Iris pallida]|uniref:UDP-glycosyltransferase 91C1-like n=1 Tax=Iris pallida TaxID=29817 RepID=A0AAX6DNY1_IRIPA|nr:UDP-glycosyltransferase 91C1-like [Iris pallida]